MRLDKFIAQNSALSRNDAKKAAKKGEVTLDNQVVTDVSQTVTETSHVRVFGQSILPIQSLYLMLNKPAGVVCASHDRLHATVLDVITETAIGLGDDRLLAAIDAEKNIQIVGRLDIDTTGLLLLTTDGQWNHRITSPNHRSGKTYRVGLAEPISAPAIQSLEFGVLLDDSIKPTAPADVDIIDDKTLKLTLYEGRYHQVKRMLGAVGNAVVTLHREKIGDIVLPPDLEPGHYRTLTQTEIASV